ncbi:UDP-N-acetylglucosamine:LPS N-acetylglucosamine transferase [Saccharopolyspora antimicrobica]|uniref:UDP-N-acetylglucosamine:LPS N-acetylglucosamine transferase n=1 Tax=Saccharopolyspora antimicrobica TaxID=455193 RepID=A0A1I4RLM8_9PSEU|nr:wax ester/triacylglycerol synthase domain-containing protein [Saccharopolyspora antimicrobica]RKT87961.1 UDP-N-acetylglucosamine:LPS N-acetylglucosamine transferase [Saccharopolyspora antimicrobica]SFM53131.1 UDP-N-acetylglucosamine:LPS N-acetylglucosamine transferase [Saccharopolyspora antimicrobica]
MTVQPRRVLLVSATIGEGHNATGRAVAEAAGRAWPGCEVGWLDALRAMGRWVPAAFNWIYVTNVESTPWLYDFFYASLWRYRWFANGSRRFVGAWSGRRLRRAIAEARPDLIVSTYPLGTAGLDWLRRRGELDVPVAAVVSDFSPHPFWVYPEADLHYVMSEASLREMRRAEPDAVGAVCVPPVVSAFRPGDRAAARRGFGLPESGFTVLVSCGSLGFGSVERAVDAALRAEGVARVVVVCGRNDALRERLAAHDEERLVALGWVEDMPGLVTCADVVVSNAGGATALEALACGRAVIMFEPIAGHGRANAELMAEAGLAELCPGAADLTATLRRWTAEPEELVQQEQRAFKHCQVADFTDQVAALAQLPRHHGRRALRPQDAFFVYATTRLVAQQTGAVLRLEGPPRSTAEWREEISGRIERRASRLPMLTRRLVLRRARRPQWAHDAAIEPGDHLRCREVRGEQAAAQVREEFFGTAVATDRPPWELLLLHETGSGEVSLLAKLHHALGDGVAVTSTLLRLLTDGPHPASTPGSGPKRRPVEVARGLLSLAGAGRAPGSAWTGPSTVNRSFAGLELPAVEVRACARELGVSSTALLLGVVAEALHRALPAPAPGQRFRVMVPRIARGEAGAEAPGNHTASVSLDLPVGPMPVARRLSAVSAELGKPDRTGQPAASGAVLAALGALPAPLHAWIVRRIYQRRFFGAVVSVLPGRRRPAHVGQARLAGVLPVLSLADGVGIAVGAISWADHVGFGVTTDTGLAPDAAVLTAHLRAAFDDLRAGDRR